MIIRQVFELFKEKNNLSSKRKAVKLDVMYPVFMFHLTLAEARDERCGLGVEAATCVTGGTTGGSMMTDAGTAIVQGGTMEDHHTKG